MCGDPIADLFLMLGIALATPIGFAFMWHNRKAKRKEMSDLNKLR